MVRDPKHAQKILGWCVEQALVLILDLVETQARKLKYQQLSKYFSVRLLGQKVPSRQISRLSYELKRRGYIEIIEGDSVRLTNKAKIKIIDKIVDFGADDGKIRLVSFDILEAQSTDRDNFRKAIKRMGFVQIQKSLWANDRNVGTLVEIAAQEYNVEDYVAYFVVEKSNIDKHIQKLLSARKHLS